MQLSDTTETDEPDADHARDGNVLKTPGCDRARSRHPAKMTTASPSTDDEGIGLSTHAVRFVTARELQRVERDATLSARDVWRRSP